MRPRTVLLPSALMLLLVEGCYPAYVGLGMPVPSGPPDAANIRQNLAQCHDHLETVAKNAYDSRESQYKLTAFISSLTLIGGSLSTFLSDNTVKTVGGGISLLTGLISIAKGKAETDLEGLQGRDATVRETWGAVIDRLTRWQAAWNAAGGNATDTAFIKADNDLVDSLNKCTATVL